MRFLVLLVSVIAVFVVTGSILATQAVADDAATCEKASGDIAIAACTRAINSGRWRGHNLAVLYSNRCGEYDNKREFDRALADCTTAIRLDPKYSFAYYNRGKAHRAQGDNDRAIADYTEVIRLDPKDGSAYKSRAIAYQAKGDLDRAIADFSQAIRLNPNSSCFSCRGTAYLAKGDLDRAIADFNEAIRRDNEAIRRDPKDGAAYNSRCWSRALIGRDLAQALADCSESLRLSLDDANALNSRGLVQLKLGAFDRAIADYSAAIAKNVKDADSLYGRGVAKLRSGDTAGGEADIAAAKAIKADIATVYAGYGVK